MALGKQAKIISDKQVRAVLAELATRRYPLRDRMMFMLSLKAGLRAKSDAFCAVEVQAVPLLFLPAYLNANLVSRRTTARRQFRKFQPKQPRKMLRLDGHSRALCRAIPFQSCRRAPRGSHLDAFRPSRGSIGSPAGLKSSQCQPPSARRSFSPAAPSREACYGPAKLRLAPRSRHSRKRIHSHKRLRPDLRRAVRSSGFFQGYAIFHAHLARPLETDRFFDARPSWRNIRRVVMKFQNRILLFTQPFGSILTIKKALTPRALHPLPADSQQQ